MNSMLCLCVFHIELDILLYIWMCTVFVICETDAIYDLDYHHHHHHHHLLWLTQF